ncbi:MAG: MtrB/PioB family decaheme-associated outer membrane protein [Elusimicrobia bacterium]|nr:MtrB/PioB family decaheme-associated outer membrane protein [Elusimicrobiota bacterium]
MSRKTFLGALLAVALATGAQAANDVMDGKLTVAVDAQVGVQARQTDDSVEKFNEYRDVQTGFFLDDFRFSADGTDSPYYVGFRARHALRADETYKLGFGRHGQYGVRFSYDSLPHNFAQGKLLYSGVGTGDLVIADQLQADLQALEQTENDRDAAANKVNPLVDVTGEDALTKGIVDGLYSTRDFTVLKLKREKASLAFDYDVANDVKTWMKVSHEKRDGARTINAGSYERWDQGAAGLTHLKDLFTISGAELAEPVDYRTIVFAVGAGVYKKAWLADAEYSFTDFNNDYSALRWDNALRSTDEIGRTAAAGGATLGNNYNRGRFVRGQLGLPPDSQSHQVNFNGSVELPLHSRFAASLGYGLIEQNQAFNPFSLNTAISPRAGLDVTNPAALPESGLHGAVTTLTQSYVLSSKPIESLSLAAKYRFYKYKNDTRRISLPGYAAWGESDWRTVRSDAGTAVQNDTLGFTKHTVDFSADYKVAKPLTVGVETGVEYWDRDEVRVDKTKEFSVGGSFIYRPADFASFKAAYKFAKRTDTGYIEGAVKKNPEAAGLRNFDWAERTRNKADGRLLLYPSDSVSVGFSGQFQRDQFAKDTRFGLKSVEASNGSVDVSYSPSETLNMFASYTREHRRSKIKNGAKDDAFNAAGPLDDSFTTSNFNPYNEWNSNISEDVDTLGFGANVAVIPEKLELDASYNFSHSRTDTYTYNPNGQAKLGNGEAKDWPLVKNSLHEIKADLGYKFTKSIKAGTRYMYEGFHLTDFAWENLQPYMPGYSAENSTRYLFADATYRNYDSHVGMVYLNYSF